MELDAYQDAAAATINPALDADGRLMDAAAGLSEEAGEVLAHVRKHLYQGRPLDLENLRIELGDALWCLAMTARAAGIRLDDVASRNLTKISSRQREASGEL